MAISYSVTHLRSDAVQDVMLFKSSQTIIVDQFLSNLAGERHVLHQRPFIGLCVTLCYSFPIPGIDAVGVNLSTESGQLWEWQTIPDGNPIR